MGICENKLINASNPSGGIFIGVWDTLNVKSQQFDISDWIEAFGEGTLSVLHQRRGDELPYEVADVVVENGIATWTFDDVDSSVVGEGSAALVYLVGEEHLARTVAIPTYTAPTIGMTGVEPPDPWVAWYTRILEASAAAQQAAAHAGVSASNAASAAESAYIQAQQAAMARSQAVEARNEARTARDDAQTAQGLAETARDQAQLYAQDAVEARGLAENAANIAEGAMEDAEAWATGTRGGEPVPSTDPAYENNAKYYAEQAADSASSAASAESGAQAAQAAAEAAAATVAQTMLAAYATETQENAATVEASLAANNLPLAALEVWVLAEQAGSGDPTPTNVRPLTARTATNIIVSPTASAEDGTTYPISLSSVPGGGVYLGRLNVLTGVLTVIAEALTLDGVNRTLSYSSSFQTSAPPGGKIFYYEAPAIYTHNVPSNIRPYMTGDRIKFGWSWTMPLYSYGYNRGSDQDHLVCLSNAIDSTYAAVNAWLQDNPITALFYLKTAKTYQLTPTEVFSILGTMNLWNDTGNIIAATYRLDPTLVYNSLRG